MKHRARRWLSVLVVLAACGGDDKKTDGGDNTGGNTNGTNSGGEDAGNNSGSTGERVPVTDADNCADDVGTTPGSECKGIVGCGGTAEALHACPLATHSCCTSGIPNDDNVNCYEGKSACTPDEGVTPCDGPEDCTDGDVCCVTLGASPKTECVPAGSCGGTVFCHTADDCDPGESCTAASFAPFWGFCG